MLQMIVAKVETIKSGEGQFGPWVMRKITSKDKLDIYEQSGIAHSFTTGSTFDEIAENLKPGQVIEAECSIDEQGKYLNLKKIAIVGKDDVERTNKESHPTPSQTQPKPQGQAEKANPDTFNRDASIERQVSVKISFEYASKSIKEETQETLQRAEQIYQWIHSGALPGAVKVKSEPTGDYKRAMGVLAGRPEPIPEGAQGATAKIPEGTQGTTTVEELFPRIEKERKGTGRDLALLKTATDLQKALHEDFKLQPNDALKELNLTNWTGFTPVKAVAAYKLIAEQRT